MEKVQVTGAGAVPAEAWARVLEKVQEKADAWVEDVGQGLQVTVSALHADMKRRMNGVFRAVQFPVLPAVLLWHGSDLNL